MVNDRCAGGVYQAEGKKPTFGYVITSGIFLGLGFFVGYWWHWEAGEIALLILAMVSGGIPIFPKALWAARKLRPDINLLTTMAVIGAAAIGQWHEGALVIFLFSLAEALEDFSAERARQAIRRLLELAPKEVLVKRPEGERIVPVEEVQVGETIIIRPGERIPLDGIVITGSSAVDQSPITGESLPVDKGVGDEVFAGTLNGYGVLEVRVTRIASDTTLARIIRLVEEAQERRAPLQRLIDRFARSYTPAVLASAIVIAVVPPLLFGGAFLDWFYRALVLLVIACPCALVISTPVTIVAGLASAARNGVLIKGGSFLEQMGALRAVAFDKTGTLTEGMPQVTDVVALNDHKPDQVLQTAAALEARSEHPLAQAVVRKAEEMGLRLPSVADFQALPGKGAKGKVNGHLFFIGSPRLFEEKRVPLSEAALTIRQFQLEGKTTILLGTDDHICGVLAVADQVRPAAPEVVHHLRQHCGIYKTVMLTGDNKGTALTIAQKVGVDEVYTELLPEDKVAVVQDLLRRYGKVAMVGDGVNDAPALAVATVGVAMGAAGSDVAIETADIALLTDDLTKIPFTIHLSRKALGIIRFNIAFSLVTKGIFFLLALVGKATLWMAIVADTGASLFVITNGLRLLRGKF